MINKKIKKKTFDNNQEYLEFYNKNRDKINIVELRCYRNGWLLKYEDKL